MPFPVWLGFGVMKGFGGQAIFEGPAGLIAAKATPEIPADHRL